VRLIIIRGSGTSAWRLNHRFAGKKHAGRMRASQNRRLKPRAQSSQFDTDGPRWDNPTMILTLDAKRRLTVPANLAPAEPGDHFIAEFDPEEDAIVFRRLARRADWLAVLRACPVEMDDVPPRSRQLPKHRRL